MQRSLLIASTVIAAAAAMTSSAAAQCVTGGTGGLIPATGDGDGTWPGTMPSSPMIGTLNVASLPAGATRLTGIKLNGLSHTWIGDVQLVLQDPADPAWYVTAYEASRGRSPFNHALYARRNFAGEVRILSGATRYSKTAAGVEVRALSRDELREALHTEMGIAERLVADWVQSGSLDASFEAPSAPSPPQPAGIRPSRRTAISIG